MDNRIMGRDNDSVDLRHNTNHSFLRYDSSRICKCHKGDNS